MTTTISNVDLSDVGAIERHIAFERAHGTARFTVPELLVWAAQVRACTLLAAHDEQGYLVVCASCSIIDDEPRPTVNLNAFSRPGDIATRRSLFDTAGQWGRDPASERLLAHVSNPSLN